MAWIQPKTDWIYTDYFNIGDYNRITGNINFLEDYYKRRFPGISITSFLNPSYTTIPYASTFNLIENSLDSLNSKSLKLDIGAKTTFTDGGTTITWKELNRIESACLKLYENGREYIVLTERLPLVLGRKDAVR